MSGDNLPYKLRPNKHIDREIFIDLLERLVPLRGVKRYAYLSMGGRHLADHTAVYRRTGIRNLYSFDFDEEIVKRQRFNRPICEVICDELESGLLPARLDTILEQFPDVENAIVWLDYTDPHNRYTQLQETAQLASKLQVGDILRVTLNANSGTLNENGNSLAWRENGFSRPGEYFAQRLIDTLGVTFVPAELSFVGEDELPSTLCECVRLAIESTSPEDRGLHFLPVLHTTYRDGQRMVTATFFACDSPHEDGGISALDGWEFLPSQQNRITEIEAPDLSLREKFRIDESLSEEPANIIDQLGFLLDRSVEKSIKTINSYKRLHRFYPTFHNIDI